MKRILLLLCFFTVGYSMFAQAQMPDKMANSVLLLRPGILVHQKYFYSLILNLFHYLYIIHPYFRV